MKDIILTVTGMTCAVCSNTVQKAISKLDGVSGVTINLTNGKTKVIYDENKVMPGDIKSAVISAGYGINDGNNNVQDDFALPKTLVISAVFGGILFYVSMGHMMGLPIPKFISPEYHPVLYTLLQLILALVVIINGKQFFVKGIKALLLKNPTMDTLVATGSGSAFIYGVYMLINMIITNNYHNVHNLYFESVGMIITLIMFGKYLESKSKRKTDTALKKLIEYMPKTATIVIEGEKITLEIEHISKGDVVCVNAGEQIPVDGVVVNGSSTVDESLLTGESLPKEKLLGDTVFAGTLNMLGYMEIEVQNASDDTVLSGITKMVEEASVSKPQISHIADRVCAVFVPSVILIAFVSALIWIIFGKDIEFALNIFISVLVIACPCALGLATPTAVTTAIGKGASSGILIRDAKAIEALKNVDTVVFDKTGTLTKGKPTVSDIITIDFDKNELIRIIAGAERASGHPLGGAVIDYCKKHNIKEATFEDVKTFPGKGIEFTCEGSLYIAGNKKLLQQNNINVVCDDADILSSRGNALIYVAKDGVFVGVVGVSDELRDSSLTAMNILNSMKIDTILLTGDNKLCAAYTSEQLNIKRYIADVLPTQKADCITDIRNQGHTVAMTGDGINDSVALMTADVGIAIGSGSEIAIEAADIVIMNDDVTSVAKSVKLAKIAMKNIKQNLFFAFVYNVVLIPVAAGVLVPLFGITLNPMIASAAMALSSVSVVTNALRIKKYKL